MNRASESPGNKRKKIFRHCVPRLNLLILLHKRNSFKIRWFYDFVFLSTIPKTISLFYFKKWIYFWKIRRPLWNSFKFHDLILAIFFIHYYMNIFPSVRLKYPGDFHCWGLPLISQQLHLWSSVSRESLLHSIIKKEKLMKKYIHKLLWKNKCQWLYIAYIIIRRAQFSKLEKFSPLYITLSKS